MSLQSRSVKEKRPRVYGEKLPGLVIKEGHPPSRLSFIQPLYGENVNPPTFARVNSACTCSDCLA